mmetsp:Transcript_107080/g.301346  ORF Transcript_107080/g.301346 Transcript_107080/m.301346 type:complete len:365 (+) Transcript_107080:358-1452(+)
MPDVIDHCGEAALASCSVAVRHRRCLHVAVCRSQSDLVFEESVYLAPRVRVEIAAENETRRQSRLSQLLANACDAAPEFCRDHMEERPQLPRPQDVLARFPEQVRRSDCDARRISFRRQLLAPSWPQLYNHADVPFVVGRNGIPINRRWGPAVVERKAAMPPRTPVESVPPPCDDAPVATSFWALRQHAVEVRLAKAKFGQRAIHLLQADDVGLQLRQQRRGLRPTPRSRQHRWVYVRENLQTDVAIGENVPRDDAKHVSAFRRFSPNGNFLEPHEKIPPEVGDSLRNDFPRFLGQRYAVGLGLALRAQDYLEVEATAAGSAMRQLRIVDVDVPVEHLEQHGASDEAVALFVRETLQPTREVFR